jgi:two-component system, cell cycle response regulator DivK
MKKKALIIEDNEQNLYLARFILEGGSYEVIAAMDSADGIEKAETLAPDIILLDIQLPTMDGYSVARRLRQNHSLDVVPIVAVTSYAMPGDKEKALESGCDGYIEKPIDPNTFLESVDTYYGLRGNRETA